MSIIRRAETALFYLKRTGFQFHHWWVGDQANWLSANNTRGKNLRMKKLNLICLIFCYQTTYHKVVAMLQHSFAEFWGRFEEFLAIFFTFFTKFFRKFWSAGSSHKPIQKTSPVPLVYVPISLINIPFTYIQKFLVSRKNVKSICLCTDCKMFQFNGTVQKIWVLRKITGG